MIFDIGYTNKEKEAMAKWANDRGVSFKFIRQSKQLIHELNKSAKSDDKLTEVAMFSHGTASNVSFGFGLHGDVNSTIYNSPDNLNEATLRSTPMTASAFAKMLELIYTHAILVHLLNTNMQSSHLKGNLGI